MNVIGAILARNEAGPDRYLERCVRNALSVCDGVLLLDDGSSDETPDLARDLGCEVIERPSGNGFWGADEATPRAQLWNEAAKRAPWVYVFDADHELLGATRDDIEMLCAAEHIDGWAFPLLDCWDSGDLHRIDGFWQAWRTPRMWLARTNFGAPPAWNVRGIHSGHIPHNWRGMISQAPAGMMIRHWSYVDPQHRAAKMERYLACK